MAMLFKPLVYLIPNILKLFGFPMFDDEYA
jgi:hypothetical protein